MKITNLDKEYSVYARINKDNYVDDIFSSYFEEPRENDILIKTGIGIEYIHVGYYNIFTNDFKHRYKIIDGKLVECVEEETVDNSLTYDEIVEVVEDLNEIDFLESIQNLKTENQMLNEQVNTLMSCILEMSEIVYA